MSYQISVSVVWDGTTMMMDGTNDPEEEKSYSTVTEVMEQLTDTYNRMRWALGGMYPDHRKHLEEDASL